MKEQHDTWIIAYSPDADFFFVTNQRRFYWESKEEFDAKLDALTFFEENVGKFIEVRNKIQEGFTKKYHYDDRVWLENTMTWYSENSPRKG